LAFALSPTLMAFHNLHCSRNRFLRSFFHGMLFHSSLKLLLIMSLTGLYLVSCVLTTSKQLRFVLPDVRGYVARPTYLSFDFSLDLIIVFLRSDFWIVLTT
jgi:hypothetical protein